MLNLHPGSKDRLRPLLAVAAALSWMSLAATSLATSEAHRAVEPIYQLRIYEIFERNKQAFHERFRDHAMRIMKRYDFAIVAQWESKSADRTEFVYLLRWSSEAVMKAQWAKFMADQEWANIKKESATEHGTLVGEIQDRTLRLTDYSPGKP